MANDGAGVPDHEATPQRAKGIVLFVITFAIFLAGFWVMAIGYDEASALIFGGGILLSTLGVILPSILEP